MARRTIAAIQRPALHAYQQDKDTPGACGWRKPGGRPCGLPKRNSVHCDKGDPRLAELEQAQDEHRRRAGDRL